MRSGFRKRGDPRQPLSTGDQQAEQRPEENVGERVRYANARKTAGIMRLQAFFSSSAGVAESLPFMESLKLRIPSPRPLPSSGSFLGPNTSRAMNKMTSRCIG